MHAMYTQKYMASKKRFEADIRSPSTSRMMRKGLRARQRDRGRSHSQTHFGYHNCCLVPTCSRKLARAACTLSTSFSRSLFTCLSALCQHLWPPSPQLRMPAAQSPFPVASVAFVVDVAVPVAAEGNRRRVPSVVLPCSPHLKV